MVGAVKEVPGMTDTPAIVVVPYSRFLECQDRRRQIAANPTRRDQPPTIDDDDPAAAVEVACALPVPSTLAEH
jgi:hypothetical protein